MLVLEAHGWGMKVFSTSHHRAPREWLTKSARPRTASRSKTIRSRLTRSRIVTTEALLLLVRFCGADTMRHALYLRVCTR